MKIKEFVRQYIDDEEFLDGWIADFVKIQTLPKGELLLESFNFSKKVFFFERGLGRAFYLKNGKDITHHFFAENQIYAPTESIFFGKPSPYSLELLEESDVAILNYDRLEELKSQFPTMEKIENLVLVNAVTSLAERLYSIQFQSAKDRYHMMLQQSPDLLLRAPLGHIASYLGMTQQTLSVIRSKI